MVVHTAHGDLGLFGRFWILIIRAAQGFRVICKTFWIFQKIRAAQNRVAQIRVAQGPPVVQYLLIVVEDALEQTEFDGCKVDGALLVGLTFSSGSSSRILKVWALK